VARVYYIDGYNVLHHCASLQHLVSHDFESARDAFAEMVARYCNDSGHRAVIVFDGRRHRTDPMPAELTLPGVDIQYSPPHLSADSVIERMVYNSGRNRLDIVVVTGDNGIRDLCRAMGSLVMSPKNFMAEVGVSVETSRSHIRHQHQVRKRLVIEDRLHPESLERLRRIREALDR
jgi:predicted RNA-binding protein with PIN domain